LPPFTILPLIFVPRDLFTSLIWFPALVAVAISLFTVVLRGALVIYFFVKNIKDQSENHIEKLVRPSLYLAVFTLVNSVLNNSIESANRFVFKNALAIQNSCNANQVCPSELPGWNQHGSSSKYESITQAGNSFVTYSVHFNRDETTNFTIYVRHNIDERFSISGGVDQKLIAKYGHYASFKKITIGDSIDEEQLVKMAY